MEQTEFQYEKFTIEVECKWYKAQQQSREKEKKANIKMKRKPPKVTD